MAACGAGAPEERQFQRLNRLAGYWLTEATHPAFSCADPAIEAFLHVPQRKVPGEVRRAAVAEVFELLRNV